MNKLLTQFDPVFGVGLRKPHFNDLLQAQGGVDFLEIVSDNFMDRPGIEHRVLGAFKEKFPMILHGVGLSIGSVDPMNNNYLFHLRALIDFVRPSFFSDHLCFSSAFGVEYHDLLPLPFRFEVLDHLVPRIQAVKKLGDIPFLLENPSYYVCMPGGQMTEAEFLCEVLERADCGLLLDINNVYVNAKNHGYDPKEFLNSIPDKRVFQYHIAGHYNRGDVLIDTHGSPVIPEVLELYRYALQIIGPRPTLLEWDNDIPALSILLEENNKVREAAKLCISGLESETVK